MADNVGPYQTASDQWRGVTFQNAATQALVRANTPPSWFVNASYDVKPSSEVVASVLVNAGARPLDRDSVDTRVVQEVKTGTGHKISSPAEVGGFPVLAEMRRALTPPSNPHAVADAAGRTQIEVWLEDYARALEPVWGARRLSAPRNLRVVKN
jgi:hypothetical protein